MLITARDVFRMCQRQTGVAVVNAIGESSVLIAPPNAAVMASACTVERSAPLVVYCADWQCSASETLARSLMEDGYSNVLELKGGIQEWALHASLDPAYGFVDASSRENVSLTEVNELLLKSLRRKYEVADRAVFSAERAASPEAVTVATAGAMQSAADPR